MAEVLVPAAQYDDFTLRPQHIPLKWVSLEPYYGTGAARWDQNYGIPEVTKDPMGFVYLRGLVRLTPAFPANGSCVRLPEDFRPTIGGIYAQPRGGTPIEVRVNPSGWIQVYTAAPASDTWVSLHGIHFHTAPQYP